MHAVALSALIVSVAAILAAGDDPPKQSFAERQKPYFALTKVEEAWKITRGGANCTIGVIDTGFDFFHPALQANLKPGWFAPGVYHTDFFSMDGHGTLVASIIAARKKEGEDGMWGMAPDCTLAAASLGMPMHGLVQLQRRFFAQNPKATMADFQKEMSAHATELRAFGEMWMRAMSLTLHPAPSATWPTGACE